MKRLLLAAALLCLVATEAKAVGLPDGSSFSCPTGAGCSTSGHTFTISNTSSTGVSALRGLGTGTTNGVIGNSQNASGVLGSSNGTGHGVYGENTTTTPSGYGVYGYGVNSTGVRAYSQSKAALSTESVNDNAIYSVSHASTKPALFTINDGGGMGGEFVSSSNDGLRATTNAAAKIAMYAENTAGGTAIIGKTTGTGAGIYTQNFNASGWAAYFDGRGLISGGVWVASDPTLKKDISDNAAGLAEVLKLRTRTWNWKDPARIGAHRGFLTTEVKQVFPEMVSNDVHEDGTVTQVMNVDAMIPVLARAIQELHAEHERDKLVAGGCGAAGLFVGLGGVAALRRRRRAA